MLTFLPLLTLFQPSPYLSTLSDNPSAPPAITVTTEAPISEVFTPESSTGRNTHISQGLPNASRGQVVRTQEIRSLPGSLDNIPVFNSNSPEVIQENGIVVSTFPPDNMAEPSAHLNYAFDGRFDIFAHHVARGINNNDVRTMYTAIVLHNPGSSNVTINLSQAASYLSQEAPFLDLPAYVANPLGDVFSGPGSRVMGEVLRGLTQPHWPTTITIAPQRSHLLVNLPIPLRRLTVPVNGTLPPGRLILPPLPGIEEDDTLLSIKKIGVPNLVDSPHSLLSHLVPFIPSTKASISPTKASISPTNLNVMEPLAWDFGSTGPDLMDVAPSSVHNVELAQSLPTNGRTTLMRLFSSGPVHVASLAMHAPLTDDNHERVPTLAEWKELLKKEGLAGPRDYPPTPPTAKHFSRFFYGRVAGVAQGSQWIATLTDNARSSHLTIPQQGGYISYALSTLDHNTFGTGQIQSAPMVTRYPDTAYRAHGNYGIHYNLSLPLYNDTNDQQKVAIKFETPIQNEGQPDSLTFLNPPDDRIFFRGTILLRYLDSWNIPQARYFHLVQRRGQEGNPLIQLRMNPGDRRLVKLEFLYPPDATPPQVVTVETLK